MLVSAALVQFLHIHKGNITWRVCQLPAAIPVQPSWTRQRSFEERSTDCQRCRRQVVCVHVCTCLCLCVFVSVHSAGIGQRLSVLRGNSSDRDDCRGAPPATGRSLQKTGGSGTPTEEE